MSSTINLASKAGVFTTPLNVFRVEQFGAVADGTTDNSTAFEAGVAYLEANGGGTLLFGAGTYAHTRVLTTKKSGVHFKGTFSGYVFATALANEKGTILKYTGTAGGYQITIEPDPALSTYNMSGNEVSGFILNGNSLAQVGVKVGSVWNYLVENIMVLGGQTASIGIWTTCTYAADTTTLNYRGVFRRVYVMSPLDSGATAFFLSGVSGGGGRNTSFCSFYDCVATIKNGTGFFLHKIDDGYFYNCQCSMVTGGTGISIRFFGDTTTTLYAALACLFYGFWSNAGIYVDAGTSYPPLGNYVQTTSIDTQIALSGPGATNIKSLLIDDSGGPNGNAYSLKNKTTVRSDVAVSNMITPLAVEGTGTGTSVYTRAVIESKGTHRNAGFMLRSNSAARWSIACYNVTGSGNDNFIIQNEQSALGSAIFVDGSNNFLGLGPGNTTPKSSVSISGSVEYISRQIAAARTLDATDHQIYANGTFNVTLPTAVSILGREYYVKNTGSGTITLVTTSSQTIEGFTTYVILPNSYVRVKSDNANWQVLDSTPKGVQNATANKSANYTLSAGLYGDHTVIFTAAATATLPSVASDGQEFLIVNDSVGVITITGTINGSTSNSLTAQYKYMRVQYSVTKGSYLNVGSN